MQTHIFIGIDLGSSSLKAVAFDARSGFTLAVSGRPLPHDRLPGGGCELAGEVIEAALAHVLHGVAAQLGARCAHVRAIGCAGHGAGLYALNAQGELVGRRAVASTDQRAGARAVALAREQGDELFEQVGCRPWAGQPTLIAAELFGPGSAHGADVRHLLFAKDYLGYLLTGEIATDASDASTAGLLDLATGRPSQAAFDAVGLPGFGADLLAPIVPSGSVVGRLLPAQAARCGLAAGLPVAIGAIDLLASMAAIRAAERSHAVAVLGTWCVNAVIGPALEPKPQVEAIVDFGQPSQRLYLENSPSSMANIAWLANALQFPDAQAVVDCAMAQPLGAHGLRFLPFVNGGSTPRCASAGFVGLKSHHTRADMARAVVDAVLALHARHLARLVECGLNVPAVTVLGGGARDRRLVQLLASFLGHRVERCGDDETGARGAALYAALSQGLGPLADATLLPAPREVVEPLAGAAPSHADFLLDFNQLIDTMSPAFNHLAGGSR